MTLPEPTDEPRPTAGQAALDDWKYDERVDELADEVERLHDVLTGLINAAEQFRKWASFVDNMRHGDDSTCQHRMRAGDLRALRRAADTAKELR